MNKRGLIGKIFLILGIIILVIGIIIGITIYQGYRVFKTIQNEQSSIMQNGQAIATSLASKKFGTEDCTRLQSIETSTNTIRQEAESACKNPLIKSIIKKAMENKPISGPSGNITLSCDNLEAIYGQMQTAIVPIKNLCANQTLMNQISNS